MTIPKFTAEHSLYRASEPYHMVADESLRSDEQRIIPQQWYCRWSGGCVCCYWNGWQYTRCVRRC
jgi:hypothetical protein